MKTFKVILLIVLSLFVVYTISCFFGPKKLDISRSATINASPESVFEEIADYAKWKTWAPWGKRDPEMINTITGDAGTVGHKMAWTSKTQGDGEQEMVEVTVNEKVKSSLKFNDWDGVSYATLMLVPAGDSTKVTWTMDGSEIPFMVRGIMLLMCMEGSMQKDYDEGLGSLKKIVEAKPKAEKLPVEEMEMADVFFIGKIYTGVRGEDIDTTMYSNAYQEIATAVTPDKLAGMPMSITHNYNMETGTMDLEIAMPVIAEMKAPKGLTSGKIPGGKAVKYIHTGTYESTGMAWGKLMEYVGKNHVPRYDPIEIYTTGPDATQNPEEYVTWLIIPVQ